MDSRHIRVERRETPDRREPRSSADDLNQRLREKIEQIDNDRRQRLRRETDRRDYSSHP